MAKLDYHNIPLSPAEITSGLDRQKWAELLILQLPSTHDGRNSWLMNYGVSAEAAQIRKEWEANNAPRRLIWSATNRCVTNYPNDN